MPVMAAVTPPTAGQNTPPIGRAVKAKAVDGTLTTTPVNPFSKAAKGTDSDTQYYLPLRLLGKRDVIRR